MFFDSRPLSSSKLIALMLFVTACGDRRTVSMEAPEAPDGSELAAHFVLDAAKSERLARVFYDASDSHPTAVYEVRGSDGVRLVRGKVVSPNVQKLISLEFFGEGDAQYWAHAQVEGGQVLLVGTETDVVQSPLFYTKGQTVPYGLTRSSSATSIELPSEDAKSVDAAVLFWEAGAFSVGPRGSWVRDLVRTPDDKAVQYQLRQRSVRYAVNKFVFTYKPAWFDLEGTDVWAHGGPHADGFTVFVDHEAGEVFDSVRDLHLDPDKDQLIYQGKKDKKWFLVSESRAEGNDPTATMGPYKDMDRKVRHHAKTNHYYAVARTDDGARLVAGAAGNKAAQSDEYARVSLARFETNTDSVATAKSDAGESVLIGTGGGTAYKSVSRLSAADNENTVAYIGKNDAGERVVMGTTAQRQFEKVSNYQLSTPSEHPVYVGESADLFYAMHEGEASEGLGRFSLFRTRSKDRVYWKAEQGESEVVGFETTPGKAFDSITSVGITPTLRPAKKGEPAPESKHTVWYDGERGDAKHRTIETAESPAYEALGKVVLTAKAFDIVYAARNSRLDSKEVTEDEKTRTVETVSLTDAIVRNGEKVTSFSRSMPGDSKGKRYLGSSTTELAQPVAVRDSDHFYYAALSDKGVHVGFDNRTDGPFDEIKELKPRPTSNDVAYFAMKGDRWAVQEGAARGTELDSMSGRLNFTPDGLQVYYSGKLEKTSHTFVGSEQYLSVRDMKLNRNKDLLVYRGERSDGWRLNVGGTHSDAFASVNNASFTDDGYGVYTGTTNADKSASFLMKRDGKAFTVDGNWARTGRLAEYHNPAGKGGLKIDLDTKNYALVGADGESMDLSKLPDPTENRMFVGMGRDLGNLSKGWLIEGVENGQLVLKNGPDAVQLSKWQSGWRPDAAHILPLYSPYAYNAVDGRSNGMVYVSNHYDRWSALGFTENDRFYAKGRKDDREHFVIAENRTGSFYRIQDLIWNPEHPGDDKVALQIRTDAGSNGYALTSASAETTPLGLADVVAGASWTQPHVEAGVNTIVWSGSQSGSPFRAVHDRRYDAVRDVVVSENSGDLSYVGTRDALHSVYAKAEHGPWYNDIRLYQVHEKSGAVAYVGDHVYALEGDPVRIMGESQRWLSRVHVGAQVGPFADHIKHLYGAADFASTVWSGKFDGLWSLRQGPDATTNSYDDIAWVHRLVEDKETEESSYHFMARTEKGWMEVHDGSEGITVDAMVEGPTVKGLPESLHNVAKNQGGNGDYTVVVDKDGRFDYRAISGTKHAFVRKGSMESPVGSVGTTWYLNGDKIVAYEAKQADGVEMALNGHRTPLYESFDDPSYVELTGDVYTVATLQSEDDEGDSCNSCDSCEDKDKFTPTKAILVNAAESVRVSDIKSLVFTEKTGLGLMAAVDGGWQAWVNGTMGPMMDGVASPQPVYGETLRNSRYVGEYGDSVHVMSTKKLTEPLDEVNSLYRVGDGSARYKYDENDFVYQGSVGHIARVYVADRLVDSAESFDGKVYEFDHDLVMGRTKANAKEDTVAHAVYDAIEAEGFAGGHIVALTDLGHTRLDAGPLETAHRTVIWDVKVKPIVPEDKNDDVTYDLAWVGGMLDRDSGTVSVYLESTVVKPKDGVLNAFRNLVDAAPADPSPRPEPEPESETEDGLTDASSVN